MRSARERLRVLTGLVWTGLMAVGGATSCGGGGDINDPPPGGTELYVRTTGDDNNPGTRQLPMATIEAAISAAPEGGADIFVAAGTYAETGLRSRVRLHGGYDPATWNRDPAAFPTTIEGRSPVLASLAADSFSIDGFTIRDVNETGGATPLVLLIGGVGIEVFNNRFAAAKGEKGGTAFLAADSPTDGEVGAAGAAAGTCTGGAGGSGSPHAGGKGGDGGSFDGFNGARGGGGGDAGVGGTTFNDGGNSPDEQTGFPVTRGAGGTLSRPMGARDGEPGTDGRAGLGGGGGGGGGGTLGFNCGGGGGGGGGGGSGGRAIGFGREGGSSIAMIVAGGGPVSVHDNVITTAGGGEGGLGPVGGAGGKGGAGGPGGAGEGAPGAGGRGGKGGDGSHGGHGGGGAGGSSIGILVYEGTTLTQTNNTFNIGPAGKGGASPGSGNNPGSNPGAPGNPGVDGEAAEVIERPQGPS